MTSTRPTKQHRDLIAIGTSAGGVEALPVVIGALPGDLAAAVLVVQHMMAGSGGHLVDIVQRRSALPVAWAEQGARITPGRVYFAPPDAHLMVVDDHMRLEAGPRENHARPSIDRLFRSVAAHYGSRSIGVVMTGMLDDGVVGLSAIRACGGAAVVQDPQTAAFPDMPAAALSRAGADRTVALEQIAPALVELVAQPAPDMQVPERVIIESDLDRGPASPAVLDALGAQTAFSCPDCRGPMWQVGDGGARHYRCYLGHAATGREILARTGGDIEGALWLAVRALHERASILDQLSIEADTAGNRIAAADFAARARTGHDSAETARRFLLDLVTRMG